MDASSGARQSVSAEVSRAVVQCTREYTGRGPTKARTTIADDMVVTRLEDTLTKGERSLADSGKGDMVIEIRRCFKETMRDAMVERVEALTGRKVAAFMSDSHIAPDIGVEIFVLEPLLPADGNGSLPSEGAG
jgi:uncharacterized protein YbcI